MQCAERTASSRRSILATPISLLFVIRMGLGVVVVGPAVIVVSAIAVTMARVNDATGKDKRKQCQYDQWLVHFFLQ